MLIQSFIPSGKEYEVFNPNQDEKAVKEVNKYINDLGKNNPRLANLLRGLWDDIQNNSEEYRDQNVSILLENLIQKTNYEIVEDFSKKWCVNEETLDYVISNYNPNRKRQNGESELKKTSNYNKYKENNPDGESKLRYWRVLRGELDEVMETEILPLRKK